VQYLATEDSRTIRKIGINMAALIGVAVVLIVLSALLA
jgi:hypothetical protein